MPDRWWIWAIELGGVGAVVAGLWMAWPPLALVVGGIAAVGLIQGVRT